MAYVFPLSWAIGRLGCSLVHDHPGIRSESWLAVRYPDWPRYDLGVLGLFFLLLLAGLFRALDARPRPPGFFAAAALLAVGVFRIWIDQYQVDPPRYYGWSVDQYNAIILLLLSALLIARQWLWREREAL
jgi:phosphatidylglycerol:prolipoprotein diacylglycerol transferase